MSERPKQVTVHFAHEVEVRWPTQLLDPSKIDWSSLALVSNVLPPPDWRRWPGP